jgi:uncharacterized membrane protein YdjX (TVP38/TMEM64 family)
MAKLARSAAKLPWRKIAVAIVACVGIALLYHRVDLETVRDYAERINGGVAFALLVALPLVGFPVSVLHVVMGIRFGVGWGMALVSLSIALQLLASYALVHLFREKFARHFEPVRRKIPRAAHGSMCLFTMLLPGVPFFAKNYVLPLLGVPLRTYLLVCLPVHIARSAVAVFFGDESDHLTPTRITWLAIYYAVTLGVSAWLFRRIRSQIKHPSSHAHARRAKPRRPSAERALDSPV